ncbi:hypothetical protein SRABI128_00158 [Microbacterium sp. Bi128]|nr:hypothetical protein SRABI128_00158 [Microbacterium sp. Bi128]
MGRNSAWPMAVENPSTICGGRVPEPKLSAASPAPGRLASSRACMNAAMDAEPITEPTVRVVL